MSQSVVIRSNKYGIVLSLDQDMPFDGLLEAVKDKFTESAAFFKNAAFAVSFEGRELSGEEQSQIIDIITENTDINIVCVVDKDRDREELFRRSVQAAAAENGASAPEAESAKPFAGRDILSASVKQSAFYEGTLRSGQVLECENGVVILGDVNPGARIISGGNIVILGALKGTAFAGSAGDRGCFIAALEMDPIQIQIGDVLAKSPDREKSEKPRRLSRKADQSGEKPMIAVSRNGNIYIEPIRKA